MTWGGVVSRVTWRLAVPAAPPGVVAVAETMFGPSASGSARLKRPLALTAAMPLTDILAVGSSTVPLTVVGLMLR